MLSRVSPGLQCPNQALSTFLFTFPVSQAPALLTWALTCAGDRPVMVRDTSYLSHHTHVTESQEGRTSVFEDIHLYIIQIQMYMRNEITFCVCNVYNGLNYCLTHVAEFFPNIF